MKKILISLCMLLITLPAIANMMKSSGNSVSFQEFFDSKKEGYIMSDWINKHSKLDSNMTVSAGFDKDLNRLYVELKTKNINNVIPPVDGKKVLYQIDKFAIECDTKTFGILETRIYDKNNQLITTLNNDSMLAMIHYDTLHSNKERIGLILANYACKSPYAKYRPNRSPH